MRILSESEVRALAENDLDGGFEACEAAFRYFGEVRDVLSHPSSAFMALPREKPAMCRLKGAHLASMGVAGARLAAPGYYYCWLIDFEGGQPVALVAEDWLHRRRTATTGALAARWLARPGATTAALIGAGKIGREFVRTLTHALPLDELRIASGSGDSARALVKEFGETLGETRLTAASSIEQAVRGADIVVTITKAKEAFLQPGWLKEGAVLLSMGGVPEVAFGVLAEIDRLIVDDIDYALAQGDLHAWVKSGAIASETLVARIDADIGEVAIGAKPGRTDDGERLLAVIQGMAVCDLAMAKMVLDKAGAGGVGQSVTI
jgi:ornithine cyclodeaminase